VGNICHTVRRRYFHLFESNPPFFSYYNTEGGALIKTVRIEGADNHVIINPREANSFKVIIGSRTWAFYAESGAEMSSWVQHFNNACDEARRSALAGKAGGASSDYKRVFVAGQNSLCCAAAVHCLLKDHEVCQVRAFVQLDPAALSATLTEANELEMMHLDADDMKTLDEAFEDVDTLIVEFPKKRFLETALAYIAAAKRARVGLVVVIAPPISYSAQMLATQFLHIERDLKLSQIKCCFVRTNLLMDDHLTMSADATTFSSFFGPEERISFVSSFDIGVFVAALAAQEPSSHAVRHFYITGSEAVTVTEAARLHSELTDTEIKVEQIDKETYLQQLQAKGLSRWIAEAHAQLAEQNRKYLAKRSNPQSDEKKRKEFPVLGTAALAEVSTDFDDVTLSERSSLREFLAITHEDRNQRQADSLPYPLLAPTRETSILPPPPPFMIISPVEKKQEKAEDGSERKAAPASPHSRSSDFTQISVPSTSRAEDGGHTVYNIHVGARELVIPKRFSDFTLLHKKITKRFPGGIESRLPGKTLFGASDEVVANRRLSFERFLLELASQQKMWPELSAFLGVRLADMRYRTDRSKRVSVISKQTLTKALSTGSNLEDLHE
jgi:uncharacterized protein YbjT (DUF2867 family)